METSSNDQGHRLPPPGTYRVDPAGTVIRFRARSMFGLVPVSGTFAVEQGEFTVAEDIAASSIAVRVRAGSFSSGNDKRDAHIRSADYLDAAAHPVIVFESGSVRPDGTDGGGAVDGRLTVRGVSGPCVLDVTAVSDGPEGVTARATTTVDRRAFGLTKQPGMVGRRIRLDVEITAAPER